MYRRAMGLKDVLAKMKLVELEGPAGSQPPRPSRGPAPPPAPSKPAPRAPQAPPASAAKEAAPAARAGATPAEETIEDILASLPRSAPKIDAEAVPAEARPGARETDFGAVYRAARVPDPPHGFTALELLKMLSSPHLAALDGRARAQALVAFLEMNPAGRVSIREVIEDAVRRDQALDAYEKALQESLGRREAEIGAQNAALQAEIDELARRNQERMRANALALDAERQRVIEWRYAKMQEERRLFDAVAPFVEANPVSLGGVAPDPQAADAAS
jgi:hypothetical protein